MTATTRLDAHDPLSGPANAVSPRPNIIVIAITIAFFITFPPHLAFIIAGFDFQVQT
jgi:hypothetical protein